MVPSDGQLVKAPCSKGLVRNSQEGSLATIKGNLETAEKNFYKKFIKFHNFIYIVLHIPKVFQKKINLHLALHIINKDGGWWIETDK